MICADGLMRKHTFAGGWLLTLVHPLSASLVKSGIHQLSSAARPYGESADSLRAESDSLPAHRKTVCIFLEHSVFACVLIFLRSLSSSVASTCRKHNSRRCDPCLANSTASGRARQ
jgi:hypothetical protein